MHLHAFPPNYAFCIMKRIEIKRTGIPAIFEWTSNRFIDFLIPTLLHFIQPPQMNFFIACPWFADIELFHLLGVSHIRVLMQLTMAI